MIMGMFCFKAHAQELNCTVEINSDQIEGTNTEIFTTLQEAINEYMNSTKFSNAQISANEKIDCRLFFTIGEYADDVISKTTTLSLHTVRANRSYSQKIQ